MQKIKTLVSVGVIGFMLVGCGESSEVRNAEFRSLSACLEGLEKDSGLSLNILTDKPDKVSGKLSNDETFACSKKESGTKGVYYEGWYTVKG
ncbi:hypothetical protein LZG37_20565 [Halomonas titanicae]|uniref:hypothetical protein n=1 Tax=Vreelandella titanicae TaxID=664683 RepID=UPI001F316337|nr:hypothetical protein [Halomonas titanicae]MCE7520537.1 hypothetical protein [Halomonas titanicae]